MPNEKLSYRKIKNFLREDNLLSIAERCDEIWGKGEYASSHPNVREIDSSSILNEIQLEELKDRIKPKLEIYSGFLILFLIKFG